mmetsp:Transcript_83162/g.269226  ORF Transcript_83162/g.269226 Transcript_83162/m.269226 type:complete len:620 (+) Transcript_83162:14-1873(+)
MMLFALAPIPSGNPHGWLGRACIAGSYLPEARTSRRGILQRSAETLPRDQSWQLLDKALRCSEDERWADAAEAWQAFLSLPADVASGLRSQAHCALGDALQRLGKDPLAAVEFAAATDLAPELPTPHLRLGTALRRLGRPRESAAAFRRVLRRTSGRRRQATRVEVVAAVSGAAVAMLRLGWLSRARRLLRAWSNVDVARGRDALPLTLLATTCWLLEHKPGAGLPSEARQEVLALLAEAAESAKASWAPVCRQLMHMCAASSFYSRTGSEAEHFLGVEVDLEDAAVVLGLASANRSALDAPQWALLEDKVELHRLLSSVDDQSRLHWPQTFVLPFESERAADCISALSGTSHSAWWSKAANGHGGHENKFLASPEEAMSFVRQGRQPDCEVLESREFLLQRDVSNCMLVDGRRFTLRLYLVVVEGPSRSRAFLAREGLVFRALEGSVVTNCSQAALQLKGSARAAGARADPNLHWLKEVLENRPDFEPGSYERLWRQLRCLASSLASGPMQAALSRRVGEVGDASVVAPLGVPKILGLDVILAETSPDGGPSTELWPWLLEINRFPALGLRSPSDADVKLPVLRAAWRLARAAVIGEGDRAQDLGCLEELLEWEVPHR